MATYKLKKYKKECIRCRILTDNNGYCNTCSESSCLTCDNKSLGNRFCDECFNNFKTNKNFPDKSTFRNIKDCGHSLCKLLKDNNCFRSACAILLTHDENKNIRIILGKEVGGFFKDQYNLPGGKYNHKTDYVNYSLCYFRIVTREIYEELKIDINVNDNTPVIMLPLKEVNNRCTPIFVIRIPEINVNHYQQLIDNDNNNPKLDLCYKEMTHIKCVDIKKEIDESYVSTFAQKAVEHIPQEIFNKLGF